MQVRDTGIVETNPKDFPVLAVNVLDRLGYQVSRASKQLDQILAVERLDEQIGQDWWRHEYRVVLRWRQANTGGMFVEVELEERKGSASRSECQKRCDRIFTELQKDAERAEAARSYKEPNTVHGTARWGTDEELRAAGYVQDKADPKRLIIGRTPDSKYLQVSERWTHAHALVCHDAVKTICNGKSSTDDFGSHDQRIQRSQNSDFDAEPVPSFDRHAHG